MRERNILITGRNSKVTKAFIRYSENNMLPEEKYNIECISLRNIDGCLKQNWGKYDVLIHTAGITLTDTKRISQKRIREYYAVNRDATIKVAQKAKASGIKQFIYLSTMMVYGNAVPVGQRFIINGNTQVIPRCIYGKSKYEGEEIRKLADDSFKVVIIREPVLYGEDFGGEMRRLGELARIIPFFPKVESTKSWLYQGNLCEFIRLAIEQKVSGTFCLQDKEIATVSEIYKSLAMIQGKKCFLIPHITWFLKLASVLNSTFDIVFSDISYTSDISQHNGLDYQIYSFRDGICNMLGVSNEE